VRGGVEEAAGVDGHGAFRFGFLFVREAVDVIIGGWMIIERLFGHWGVVGFVCSRRSSRSCCCSLLFALLRMVLLVMIMLVLLAAFFRLGLFLGSGTIIGSCAECLMPFGDAFFRLHGDCDSALLD